MQGHLHSYFSESEIGIRVNGLLIWIAGYTKVS